jgi:hypothetical protein
VVILQGAVVLTIPGLGQQSLEALITLGHLHQTEAEVLLQEQDRLVVIIGHLAYQEGPLLDRLVLRQGHQVAEVEEEIIKLKNITS